MSRGPGSSTPRYAGEGSPTTPPTVQAEATPASPGPTTCTTCHAPIRWVLTIGGRRVPLDPASHPEGNIVPIVVEGAQRAKVLTGAELPAQGKAWRSHNVTCPDSEHHRRRVARALPRCGDCRGVMDAWLPEHGHRYHIGCGPLWPSEREALKAAVKAVAA